MPPLFRKLNLATHHREILVVNAPESFKRELQLLADIKILTDPGLMKRIEFSIAFVRILLKWHGFPGVGQRTANLFPAAFTGRVFQDSLRR
jgi:hypothetical protein